MDIKYNTTVPSEMVELTENCPKCCLWYGKYDQLFIH
jgi:hypothetical protein